jgi:hypothetical protein
MLEEDMSLTSTGTKVREIYWAGFGAGDPWDDTHSSIECARLLLH